MKQNMQITELTLTKYTFRILTSQIQWNKNMQTKTRAYSLNGWPAFIFQIYPGPQHPLHYPHWNSTHSVVESQWNMDSANRYRTLTLTHPLPTTGPAYSCSGFTKWKLPDLVTHADSITPVKCRLQLQVSQIALQLSSGVHNSLHTCVYLADPGEARSCSTNSLVINSLIKSAFSSQSFLPQLYGAATPKRLEIALQVIK